MGASLSIIKIKAARAAMLALSPLQTELRGLVQQRIDRDGITISAAATQSGIAWAEVKRFLAGTTSVSGGRKLKAFTKFAKRPDLHTSISEIGKSYSNARSIVLCLLDVKAVSIAFDLLEQYYLAQPIRMEDFAKAFGKHEAIVFGVLNYRFDASKKLEDATLADEILDVMADGAFVDRTRASALQHQRELDSVWSDVMTNVESIQRSRGLSKQEIARMLHLERACFHGTRTSKASMKHLRDVLEKTNAMLAQGDASKPAPRSSPRAKPIPPVIAENGPAEQRRDDAASEMTPPSITADPPVLTSDTFSFLDHIPDKNEMTFVRQSITLVRVMIERLTQIRDNASRARIQNELSGAVEDLVLACKLHSYEFPNRVMPLFDAEREGMSQLLPPQRSTRTNNDQRRRRRS